MEGYQVVQDGRPHLDRLRIVHTPWFGICLHRIHGPDAEPAPHDHPWWFCSLILSGSYAEMIWPDPRNLAVSACRSRPRWSLAVMPLRYAHKIICTDGLLWTLAVTGPRRDSWRFWTADGPVDWREYLKAGEDSDDSPS
jgi:hypothetical protein